MCFASDLFVVEDNGELDDALVQRLKIRDQFQGARHELFAEATSVLAKLPTHLSEGAVRSAYFPEPNRTAGSESQPAYQYSHAV
jgi:hypothetical protein